MLRKKLHDLVILVHQILTDLDTLLQFEQGIVAAERPLDPTLKR
jgi:hypothetical protein